MCAHRLFDGPLCCTNAEPLPHTHKLCECGCGEPAPIARDTNRRLGHRKGEPLRFVSGHNGRAPEPNLDGKYLLSPSGCWEWVGTKNPAGYGRVCFRQRWFQAHRISYERHVGPIPDGLHLDHLCRNRSCINPDHLEPVTSAENTRRGLLAKLTAEQVSEIRASDERPAALASRFGVSVNAIRAARNHKTWRAA